MVDLDIEEFRRETQERIESVQREMDEAETEESKQQPPKRRSAKEREGKIIRMKERTERSQETPIPPEREVERDSRTSADSRWRGFTTYIEETTYRAVMKMAADRKFDNQPDATHKNITNEALRRYIEQHGYGKYLK